MLTLFLCKAGDLPRSRLRTSQAYPHAPYERNPLSKLPNIELNEGVFFKFIHPKSDLLGFLKNTSESDLLGFLKNTSEKEKYKILEIFLKKNKSPKNLEALAELIGSHKIDTDENDIAFSSKEERFECTIRLFSKAKTPKSLHNLAVFIYEEKIHRDENGIAFSSEEARFDAVVRLFREANLPGSLNNLAVWISEGKIKTNKDGSPISEEEKDKTFVDFLRMNESPEGLFNLAAFIYEGEINTNENGEVISSDEDRYKVAARLFKKSKRPEGILAFNRLVQTGKIYINERGDIIPKPADFDKKKSKKIGEVFASREMLKVAQTGDLLALELYQKLGKKEEEAPIPDDDPEERARTWRKKCEEKRKEKAKAIFENPFVMSIKEDKDHVKNLDVRWDGKSNKQFLDSPYKKRTIELISEMRENSLNKMGAPEKLTGDLDGWWSRRITAEHRLVYKIEGEVIVVRSCLGHYE